MVHMDKIVLIQELGKVIRERRTASGLTQAALARRAGLSRNTLNLLENGRFPDLGLKKAAGLLSQLNMEIEIQPKAAKPPEPDYVGMAAMSASVSFRTQLSPEELVQVLLSARIPKGKEAHVIALLEESSPTLFAGLVGKMSSYVSPEKIRKNLQKLAKQLGLARGSEIWKRAH